MKSLLASLITAFAISLACPGTLHASWEPPLMQTDSKARRTGREAVNGVNYYYDIHGAGEPLLLLHGGLGSIDMFASILPSLTERREVIVVDLHGHGRTPLGDRSIRMADIGADMAMLMDALGAHFADCEQPFHAMVSAHFI